jgi:Ran GTPase-activating protein (RanGAP) involved in mRNA processing and transport
LGNQGFSALARSATLNHLEELDLSSISRQARYSEDDPIRTASVRSLMDWPGLATLRKLNLAGNDLSSEGIRALLQSPHAAGLKELSLRDTRLDGAAMAEFATAVAGLSLDMLDVGQNILGADGAEAVASAPCLKELKALRMDRCEVPSDGAAAFCRKARFLGGLRRLDVGYNHFGAAGVRALLARKPAELHTLNMQDNDLLDGGVAAVVESAAAEPLLDLDLSRNQLTATAADTLARSTNLSRLLVLRMAGNTIPPKAAKALASSPLGQRLKVLEAGK